MGCYTLKAIDAFILRIQLIQRKCDRLLKRQGTSEKTLFLSLLLIWGQPGMASLNSLVDQTVDIKCNYIPTQGALRFSARGQLNVTPFSENEGFVSGTVDILLLPPGNDVPPIDLGLTSIQGQWKQIPAGQLGRKAVDKYVFRPNDPDASEFALGQWIIGYQDGTLTSSFIRLKNGQEYRAGCFLNE
jgi:hypothetical protein